ncbi:hypothetical protein QOZ95_004494 [Paenibacillus brasilensis]|uniref:Uncharacterized protein n=1 Tax=Paenibacillus brasilensis TaxID=128574 RepID=A0ABU0L4S7_9BACL|nr:hypothetical protein [Paenibacillus brasilensis]
MNKYVYSVALNEVLMQKTIKQPARSGRHEYEDGMLGNSGIKSSKYGE